MEEKPQKSLRYNEGKPDWTLIHFKSILPLVDVMTYGAFKYSIFETYDRVKYKGSELSQEYVSDPANGLKMTSSGRDNWKIGFEPRDILKSLMRHVVKICDGEMTDGESGKSHIGHAMANLMMMQYHIDRLNTESDGGR